MYISTIVIGLPHAETFLFRCCLVLFYEVHGNLNMQTILLVSDNNVDVKTVYTTYLGDGANKYQDVP